VARSQEQAQRRSGQASDASPPPNSAEPGER
jgi:hypothetical protein